MFQVKNKAPAEVQITAEQLLREAKERELELLPPPPKQKITDKEELNDYKLKKRKVRADSQSHVCRQTRGTEAETDSVQLSCVCAFRALRTTSGKTALSSVTGLNTHNGRKA